MSASMRLPLLQRTFASTCLAQRPLLLQAIVWLLAWAMCVQGAVAAWGAARGPAHTHVVTGAAPLPPIASTDVDAFEQALAALELQRASGTADAALHGTTALHSHAGVSHHHHASDDPTVVVAADAHDPAAALEDAGSGVVVGFAALLPGHLTVAFAPRTERAAMALSERWSSHSPRRLERPPIG